MADRQNKKHLILVSDGLIAAVTFLMILLMPHLSSEPVFLTALLLMSFLRAAGAGIQNPAVQAAVSQLVPEEHRMQYNGIYSAMQSFVQLTAPAAAALIMTSYSLRTTLMADIFTAILGMGILCSLSLPTEKNQEDPSFPLDEISVGIRYACSSGTIAKHCLFTTCFLFHSTCRVSVRSLCKPGLRKYLLVPDCSGACRLWRHDGRRSAPELLET